MIASGHGHHECVGLLLKAGVKKDTQNSDDGCTALLLASARGYHVCVDLLLKAGANKYAQSNGGWTALSSATKYGHQACIQLLQQADAASAAAAMSPLLGEREGRYLKVEEEANAIMVTPGRG